MCLLKVTFFVSVLVFLSVSCKKNSSARKDICRGCFDTNDTRCIAQNCEYNGDNLVDGIDNVDIVRVDLKAPEVHCQDHGQGLLALIWPVEKNTSYFLEYFTDSQEREYTDLSTEGSAILNDLRANTEYTILMTSVTHINFNLHLQRSPPTTFRTSRRRMIPLPVPKVFLASLDLMDGKYTATVRWQQALDKSCFYDIVWFGDKDIGDYTPIEITDPLSANEVNITDLDFGQQYFFMIRAISVTKSKSVRNESPEAWFNGTTPTCLETFKSLTNCIPEVPEDLEVTEMLRSRSFVGFPRFDIEMTWSPPNYIPDFYVAFIVNNINNDSMQMNITGNETTAQFINVELDSFYHVALVAYSVKGPSPPAYIYRLVNSTALLNVNTSPLSIELILLIVTPFVIIGLILMLLFNHFLVKKVRSNYFKEIDEKTISTVNYVITPTNMSENSDEWELLPEKLSIKGVLGEGAFGVVKKGYYYGENGNSTEVAIKMLKDNPTQEEMKQFCQEIDIMKSVPSHPHLVSLIGCVTRGTSKGPLLVVEYCSKGDLQTYLRHIWSQLTNSKKEKMEIESMKCASNKLYDFDVEQHTDVLQPKDLISFARQIALGMEYLSSLKLIHRDLAARNVLICEDNTVKISDFGLSRDVYYDKVYCKTTGGKLPIRWMALESMTHQVYTTQSDVWSFGILLWEIVTLGSTPYPGISTGDLLPLLKEGYRMEKPCNCSSELYTIMCKCWKATPRERPTFFEIRKALDSLLEGFSNYLSLNTKEAVDISVSRKNNVNKYKNVNFSEGYVIQMKGV